jgi:hypothetical protein
MHPPPIFVHNKYLNPPHISTQQNSKKKKKKKTNPCPSLPHVLWILSHLSPHAFCSSEILPVVLSVSSFCETFFFFFKTRVRRSNSKGAKHHLVRNRASAGVQCSMFNVQCAMSLLVTINACPTSFS